MMEPRSLMTDVGDEMASPVTVGLRIDGWREDFSVSCPRLDPVEHLGSSDGAFYCHRWLVGVASIHAHPGIQSEHDGERRRHRVAEIAIRPRQVSDQSSEKRARGVPVSMSLSGGGRDGVKVALTIALEEGQFEEIWRRGTACFLSEASLRLAVAENESLDNGASSYVSLEGYAYSLSFAVRAQGSGAEIALRSALEQEATQRLRHVSVRDGVWGQAYSVTAELGASLSKIRDLDRYNDVIADLRGLLPKAREVFHEADFVQIDGESKNVYALTPWDFSNYLSTKETVEKRKLELSYQELWPWPDIDEVIERGEAMAGPQADGFKCAHEQIESLVTKYLQLGVRSRTLERVFLSSLCYSSCLAYARGLHSRTERSLVGTEESTPIPSLSSGKKLLRDLTKLAKAAFIEVVALIATFTLAWILTGQNTVAAWIVTTGYSVFRWIRHILLAKFRYEVKWELTLRELGRALLAFNNDAYNPTEMRARFYKLIQAGGGISPRLLDLLDRQARSDITAGS